MFLIIFVPIGLVLAFFVARGLWALAVMALYWFGEGLGWVLVQSRRPAKAGRQEPGLG